MSSMEKVIKIMSEESGREVTEAEVKAYLERREMTTEQYLEEDAKIAAQYANFVPPEPPDPERDPEGYEYYKYMTNPQG